MKDTFYVNWAEMPQREIFEGFKGSFAHTESMTLACFEIEEGAILPLHAHPHEQLSNVIEGQFEMTVGDETQILTAGKAALIPAHVPHSGRALTFCRIIDIFSPVREDYQ